MRRKLLLGNWKMNKTIAEAKEFAKASKKISKIAKIHNIDIGVAPTYLSLTAVKKYSKNMIVAAQNVHFEDHGAFTGEISIPMLLEIGIKYVIIGHSERRMYDNETNEKCQIKLQKLIENQMIPIYCVGESLKQFEEGKTNEIVKEQVRVGLSLLNKDNIKDVIIAYEPVWSIGTGKNASTEIAQNVCKMIRDTVLSMFGKEASEEVRILYGGSVKPNNVRSYLSMNDVDGALVGGASLKIDSFSALLNNLL